MGICRITALLLLLAAPAGAQQLTIQGDRFAVDGTPRFLTVITYFGAMGALDAAADLQFLHDAGFDGARIWPNSPDGPTLMRADGSLDPDALSRLTVIHDRAREQRLIVDVSFTAEQIDGLDAARFQTAIAAAARALASYDNILFDIQNERDVYGPFGRPLAATDVAAIAAAIKRITPSRVVTASNAPGTTPSAAAQFTADTGLDVTAYHDDRVPDWYDRNRLAPIVAAMKANGRPAYLQEPSRFPFPSTDRADYFRLARANAKRLGAAGWCYHTDLGFNLRLARFRDLLQSRQEPDWAFVTSLVARIHVQTSDAHFVTAEGGGGSAVHADRRQAGEWETFVVVPRDGGPVLDGDRVTIGTSDGRHFLQAAAGGGDLLTAAGAAPGPWETFTIDTGSGGPIADGDQVRLRTTGDPAWFVSADAGGGGLVYVNRRSAGAWETFLLRLVGF